MHDRDGKGRREAGTPVAGRAMSRQARLARRLATLVRTGAAAAAVLVTLAACASAEDSLVTGQASYRERVALSDTAVFEAMLLDVSRPDATAEAVGSVRIEPAGQVPIRFAIPYDPGKIDERYSYAVRARIIEGERLLFTTDKVYPVLTRGNGSEVELLLIRVRGIEP